MFAVPYWAPRAGPARNSSYFLVHNMIIIHYYKLYFSYINNVRRRQYPAHRVPFSNGFIRNNY